jgi:hypothetical protein
MQHRKHPPHLPESLCATRAAREQLKIAPAHFQAECPRGTFLLDRSECGEQAIRSENSSLVLVSANLKTEAHCHSQLLTPDGD